MARNDTVGSVTSHRKRSTDQMTNGNLQDSVICPVIDGQRLPYLWNIDVAHDPCIGYVQDAVVFLNLLFCQGPFNAGHGQFPVVFFRFFKQPVIIFRIQLGYSGRIGSDCSGLMKAVPPVSHAGIAEKADSDQDDQTQNKVDLLFFNPFFHVSVDSLANQSFCSNRSAPLSILISAGQDHLSTQNLILLPPRCLQA